jgi:hypothetical protein
MARSTTYMTFRRELLVKGEPSAVGNRAAQPIVPDSGGALQEGLVACRGATITRLRIGCYGHRSEPLLTQ